MTELRTIELRVGGFVHHNKKLNVENPERPGAFLSADVRDPIFEAVPNIYIEAASRKSTITVQAKFGYRAGLLERIYILDSGDRLTTLRRAREQGTVDEFANDQRRTPCTTASLAGSNGKPYFFSTAIRAASLVNPCRSVSLI